MNPDHRDLVTALIQAHLPPATHAWIVGSRATGRARPFSDLDLLIDAGRPLTLDEQAILREAFSESDLPYPVDLLDWHRLDPAFRDQLTKTPLSVPSVSPPRPPC